MIELQNIKKSFDADTKLVYPDLVFESGKTYVLLGPSGCGKSTLLNMIAGITTPDSGSIIVDGENITERKQEGKDRFRIKNIGYIFQDFKLIENMTVADNINILRIEGVDTSKIDEYLEILGIADKKNKKVKHLSGGEKQRVAIVRALVKEPKIVLADEPTGSLNYEIGKTVIEQLVKIAKGKTLIAVTHDSRMAEYFDEVIDFTKLMVEKEGAFNA